MMHDPNSHRDEEIVHDRAGESWLEDFRRTPLKAPSAELRVKVFGPTPVARTGERRRLFRAAAALFIVVAVGQSLESRTPRPVRAHIGNLTIERPLDLGVALEARTRWLERLTR